MKNGIIEIIEVGLQGPPGPPGGSSGGDVIDDDAGAGITNKTWSAAKLTAEFAALRALIEAGGCTDPDPGPGTDPDPDPETYTPPPFDDADAPFSLVGYTPPPFNAAHAAWP